MVAEYIEYEPTASQALVTHSGGASIELAIAAWLHAKRQRSNSERTARAYADTLASFRAVLRSGGLDLDSDRRAVGLAAQAWASAPRENGEPVASSTINQRLAILSSFYAFAIRRELLAIDGNPIDRLERAKVQDYAGARSLDTGDVAEQLAAIDRRDTEGKRDYSLLCVALETGRRRAELAALRWQDVMLSGGRVTLTWRRAKGGKVMVDQLTPSAGDALLGWLYAAYGRDLGTLAPDAPVWISLARNGTRGHQLTPQAITLICERRLGVSKVHALRHTFAHSMEAAGAPVSLIQARLGHSNLATTGRYLSALRASENPYAEQLAAMFGYAAPAKAAKTPRRTRGAR